MWSKKAAAVAGGAVFLTLAGLIRLNYLFISAGMVMLTFVVLSSFLDVWMPNVKIRRETSSDNIFEDGSCTFIFYGPGRAIQFDGDEDYIDINGNTIGSVFGENSSDFTFSMWVFPDTSETNNENQILVSHADSSGNKNFELGMSPSGNIIVFIQNVCGDNELSIGSGEFESSEWHYLTVTFSLGIVSAFLDGNMYTGQTCGETIIPIESAKMTLGKYPINELFYNGILHEIRIDKYAIN